MDVGGAAIKRTTASSLMLKLKAMNHCSELRSTTEWEKWKRCGCLELMIWLVVRLECDDRVRTNKMSN